MSRFAEIPGDVRLPLCFAPLRCCLGSGPCPFRVFFSSLAERLRVSLLNLLGLVHVVTSLHIAYCIPSV